MRPLDNTDRRIIDLLQSDAKLTNKEVAAQLNMTTTPVYERIKRMEEDGYIRKYVALADKDKLGLSILAFCNVSLKEHARDYLLNFETQVRSLPEVIECYHIAGLFDYLLKVVVPDMPAYHDFIVKKLATFDYIGNVQSMFVMTEIKYSTKLPV